MPPSPSRAALGAPAQLPCPGAGAGTATAARPVPGKRSYCSTTMVLTLARTPSPTSTVTMRVPTVRIGSSRWTLRRSMSMPRASLMASTMSCEVTEPNRRPSSPAWWAIVRTVLLSSSALSSARWVASAAARSAVCWRRWAAAIERGWPARPACAGSGSCGGSPWRRRRRCRARRRSRRPGGGWPGASRASGRGRRGRDRDPGHARARRGCRRRRRAAAPARGRA